MVRVASTLQQQLHGSVACQPGTRLPHWRRTHLPAVAGLQGLAGPVKDLRPTHLVVNSGLWASSNTLPGWPAIAAAGAAAVEPQGGRAIWRGTTANRGRKVPVQP